MKICEKCGAHNSDKRSFCVDCNEKLGDKLSEFEEQQIQEKLDEKMENMYNKRDPFYVSLFDKIIGAISLLGVLCGLVLMIIGKISQRDFEYMWLSAISFLLTSIEAFIPRLTWTIEKMRLGFYINSADDAEPSEFYITCRKAAILLTFCIGVLILVISLFNSKFANIN